LLDLLGFGDVQRNDRNIVTSSTPADGPARGVWEHDATLPGFKLSSRGQLTDQLVILPKLFRRLAEYLTLDEPGKVSLAGFPAFLQTSNDRLFTVPAGQATHLDTLIQRRGQTLKLTLAPEQIVFQEG
jgi:hypothetical protein